MHKLPLFEEWKYTWHKGRPPIWKHPIRWYLWGKWNRMTHYSSAPETLQPVIRDVIGSFPVPSRDPRDRKPAPKKLMRELTADSALFL